VWTILFGPILSLLPTRWRNAYLWRLHIHWSRATLISALIEAGIGAYFAWTAPSRTITSVAAYFAAEGTVRFYAAISTGEALGTFPLIALADLGRIAKRSAARPKLPLVRDEVLRGDASCDLKIASCHEKSDWKYPFTIKYEGTYFQVTGQSDLRVGPRPYIYLLRRLPPGEVARGLKDYSPDDILTRLQPVARVESS
jgi:hypothetical protein